MTAATIPRRLSMRAKVIIRFEDMKAGKIREVGEVFICNASRFKEINSTKYGQLVVEEPKKD